MIMSSPLAGRSPSDSSGLKELTRQRLPALFQALKALAGFKEDMDVRRALKNLDRLSQCSKKDLANAQIVEALIKQAGLHKSIGVGEEYEWPAELDAYTDKGLKIWQYPSQFSKYLAFLSHYQIRSYLEIGVAYGGTFVFTVSFLDRFSPGLRATCIDVRDPSPLIKRFSESRSFQYVTDKSSELFRHVDANTNFDLVLVDGDHSKQGAMSDFELVRDKAKIIAFHDIVNFKTPGAVEAWLDLKENHSDAFECYEFIDQYDELIQKNHGKSLLGIGVAVRKDLAT
jgi:cephalosporin hydroxylase